MKTANCPHLFIYLWDDEHLLQILLMSPNIFSINTQSIMNLKNLVENLTPGADLMPKSFIKYAESMLIICMIQGTIIVGCMVFYHSFNAEYCI